MNPPLACTSTLRGRTGATETRFRSDRSEALLAVKEEESLAAEMEGDDTAMEANCAAMAVAAAVGAITVTTTTLKNAPNC